MKSWYKYLKQGLSRNLSPDRISDYSKKTDFKGDLSNVYPYLKQHWRKGLFGFLIVIFASLFTFPSPLITRYLIDEVILNHKLEHFIGAILLLISILAAEKIVRVFEEFYFARLEQHITLDIHQDLISRVLRLPKAFFDDHQTGYLMSRLSEDVEGLRWFFSSSMIYILSNVIRFVGGIGFLFYLEWRLSIAVLIFLPGLGFCIRYFSNKIHILSHQNMEQKAKASSHLQASLSKAAMIKAFASENRTQRLLMSALKSVFQVSLELTTVNSLANLLINSMPGMARAVVLAAGAIWVIKGQWTLGSLLAYQAYLAYVFGPAQFLATANLQLQKALAALKRVSVLFDIVPEENMGTGQKVQRLAGDIEFKDVCFAYNGCEPVLKDVCLHIHPGEKVAIVGPSGVGKTTLLSLILRFYRPTQGEIYFDNQAAAEYEVSSLRKRIGYVSQQPRLLAGTIIENICYGHPDASIDQVVQASRVAGIKDFIDNLPDGYETKIGEEGVKLSEGQKQRVSIARALIKDPDILILDEPTAALDHQTEKSIFDALPEMIRRKTLFVVTHRPLTIQDSDRIFLLKENCLVEAGSHQFPLESGDFCESRVVYQ